MRKKYVWQETDWPQFKWSSEPLLPILSNARKLQGQLIARADMLGLQNHTDLLVEEAFSTAAIEGENLDRHSIRSSVAKRLGLPIAGLVTPSRHIDGLVEMLIDATSKHDIPLTVKRLHGWQAALFPTGYSGIYKINIGKWRTGNSPMQVVSGAMGKETVHFEAPPSMLVSNEIKSFLAWWKKSPSKIDGLIRAGIAHFWFVTIHPYDDGNGRLARAITDTALCQDDRSTRRLFSLSSQIIKERDDYYRILETCQRGTCDITSWLEWFLTMFIRAVSGSELLTNKIMIGTKFWQIHGQKQINDRQRKVINKLLEAEPDGYKGGMNNRKYVAITKTSRETAKRDLVDLEYKGLLMRNPGKGRSVSYVLDKLGIS